MSELPFTTTCLKGWRAEEIIESITTVDQTFACHQTIEHDDSEDGDRTVTSNSEHCAGALILLEKQQSPNQMMRISERLGMYDRFKLNMGSKVFDTFDEFIDHHS